ncbi:hypothetical protein ORIO_04270 [Cereibacter azotoformans]|uniref:hypothetical protein n=1 Tax=Cereibacter azotoformans TaxID=43057 RepID=UPI001EE9C65A|nr:hypothetical protein [Cereibacter azotoformans]ULB09143.1 hypothetical protein ORIO_04270 [Cereibacter azotoformans]
MKNMSETRMPRRAPQSEMPEALGGGLGHLQRARSGICKAYPSRPAIASGIVAEGVAS